MNLNFNYPIGIIFSLIIHLPVFLHHIILIGLKFLNLNLKFFCLCWYLKYFPLFSVNLFKLLNLRYFRAYHNIFAYIQIDYRQNLTYCILKNFILFFSYFRCFLILKDNEFLSICQRIYQGHLSLNFQIKFLVRQCEIKIHLWD